MNNVPYIEGRLTRRNGRIALGQHEFHAGEGLEIKLGGWWIPGRVEYDLFQEPIFYPSNEEDCIRLTNSRMARLKK